MSHKQKVGIFHLLAVCARNVCVNHSPALFTAEPEEFRKRRVRLLLSPELGARGSENWCKPVAAAGLAVPTGLLIPSPQGPLAVDTDTAAHRPKRSPSSHKKTLEGLPLILPRPRAHLKWEVN